MKYQLSDHGFTLMWKIQMILQITQANKYIADKNSKTELVWFRAKYLVSEINLACVLPMRYIIYLHRARNIIFRKQS